MASRLDSSSPASTSTSTSTSKLQPPPRPPVPQRAGSLPPWLELVPRAVRIAIDLAAVVALYEAWQLSGSPLRVIVVWMLSLLVFPHPRLADRIQQRREVPRAFLLTGLALVVLGVSSRLGLFGATLRQHGPAGDTLWLGLAMAFAGAAHLRSRPRMPAASSIGGIACGLASVASGAVWVWLALR